MNTEDAKEQHLRDAKYSLSIVLRMIDHTDAPLFDEVVILYKHLAFILWAMDRGRKEAAGKTQGGES